MKRKILSNKDVTMILKSKALKATPQRIAMIEEIFEAGHASVSEIYARMKNRFPSISIATIYKIIETFLHNSIVEEIHITSEKRRYELKKDSHAHYICRVCGKIYDIYLDSETVFEQAKRKGYKPEKCNIYLYGKCPDCT